ncbi:Sensor histidine kinase YpdA [compost metagenome]
MIVDDDPVNLQVLINLLSMENYKVVAVHQAEDAIEALTNHAQIDLVITDWMMPGMSGLELCRKLRKQYSLSDLPVLMLTSRSRPEDIQIGFQSGVNDFLSKPVHAGELRARVRTLIELRNSVQAAIRTEMAFLQAQIKPHFLFNALNTMIALLPIDPDKTTQLLNQLSRYLRGSFDFHNRDHLAPLHRELDLVNAYLYLEQARFEERLNIEIEVDADLGTLIPPLSIQPIVENAVRHGIMKKEEGGTIRLEIKETKTILSIVVSDNGVGMTAGQLGEILSDDVASGSVGLKNIHKRLLTLFGIGLQIESKLEVGTEVSFEVPKSSTGKKTIPPEEELKNESYFN